MFKPFKYTSVFALLTSALVLGFNAHGQNQRVPTKALVEGIKSRDGRWFEVEMIVFERFDNQDFREDFDSQVPVLKKPRRWDLLTQHLQPDISRLRQSLPSCYQQRDPLAKSENAPTLSPAAFYQAMVDYQTLIYKEWQFTSELCLLPDEKMTEYWQLNSELTPLSTAALHHIPIDSVPERVVAGDYDDFHDVYLLAEQNLQLKEHFYTLKRNRNLNPLLHIGWRQPGLSKRRSIPVYLFAGANYAERFRYDGSEIIAPEAPVETEQEQDLTSLSAQNVLNLDVNQNIERFMQKLQAGAVVDISKNALTYPNQSNLPDSAWQLDGFVQIHLNHYLFINSEFNFRQPQSKTLDAQQILQQTGLLNERKTEQLETTSATDQNNKSEVEVNYLQNYYFKQNRRVYSGDIHYLDHPKFGILIQIRKYRH